MFWDLENKINLVLSSFRTILRSTSDFCLELKTMLRVRNCLLNRGSIGVNNNVVCKRFNIYETYNSQLSRQANVINIKGKQQRAQNRALWHTFTDFNSTRLDSIDWNTLSPILKVMRKSTKAILLNRCRIKFAIGGSDQLYQTLSTGQ